MGETRPQLSSNFSRNHTTSCVLNAIIHKEPALRVDGGLAQEKLFLLCGLKSKASRSQRLSFQFIVTSCALIPLTVTMHALSVLVVLHTSVLGHSLARKQITCHLCILTLIKLNILKFPDFFALCI